MKKNTHLKIGLPQPCSEDWDQMTSVEKGRFCGSCEKIVIDFTAMSDQALIDFFVTKNQRACGRFRTDQLDRNLRVSPPVQPSISRGAFLLAGSLSLLSLQSHAQSQEIGKAVLTGESLIHAVSDSTEAEGEANPYPSNPAQGDSVTNESTNQQKPAEVQVITPPHEVTAGVPQITIQPLPESRRNWFMRLWR